MTKSTHPRIMHVASGDLWAGAEVQLFTLARSLHTRCAIPVCVVLLNHATLEQELRKAGIKVIVLDETRLNGIQILYFLVRTIRAQKPDVIHTHRFKENILGSIAALLAGTIPSLRTAHGAAEHPPSWKKPNKLIIHFTDWLCGRFLQRKIIAVSDELAMILEKSFPSEKVSIIENGIDLDIIHSDTDRTQSDSASIRIGIAGRLVPVKRVDLFIRTARYILDNFPDLKANFYILGDGPLRQELETLSRDLGTEDVVHFEGHISNIHQMLQKLDVLLMTSDHEGLPMILLEAMALKTPIIARATGGIPKLLDQGACGILVHDHSASGYAREIYTLAKDPQVRSSISQNALNRVTKLYSAEQNARTYLSEYSALSKKKDIRTRPE